MEAIFSSKLYKASTRKKKIAAAISNPVNLELVQQLNSYLDDPVPENKIVPPPTVDNVEVDAEGTSPSEAHTHNSGTRSSGTSNSVPSYSVKDTTNMGVDDSNTDIDDESSKPVSDSESKLKKSNKSEDSESEPKESIPKGFHSTKKSSKPAESNQDESIEESTNIQSATTLYPYKSDESCCDQLRVDAAAIKGTLNVREDTAGVSRIQVKDNELWIYYQDSVNLNSIMEPAIEVLNGVGFTQFEFNRLARSSNAIVFDILCVPEDVEPMSEDE